MGRGGGFGVEVDVGRKRKGVLRVGMGRGIEMVENLCR